MLLVMCTEKRLKSTSLKLLMILSLIFNRKQLFLNIDDDDDDDDDMVFYVLFNFIQTLKAPITTAADDSFKYFFFNFSEKTSEFHGEFMSPALFLFEVLKMVKLTRGPLVLYQIPKY